MEAADTASAGRRLDEDFSRMNQRFSSRGLFAAAVAFGLLFPAVSHAQVTGQTTQTTDAQGRPQTNVTMSVQTHKKKKVDKTERVQQSKDTRRENKKEDKLNPLAEKDATLPDKQLYDKALLQEKKGHFDVARLDLQTLLNTYPDSQYQMRAKLAIADCWYNEGGSAALAQAEQEYKDFITFFPNVPEAAEAQMRVGDIYFKQMDVPDRDYKNALSAEAEYRTMLKQYPDAPPAILKQAKQKLREVQEVLAARETNIAQFYASHENWPASIARYQTVADTYPQYSHMDDTLIAIGDAYAAEARGVRSRPTCAPGVVVPCLPEGAKSALEQEFDGKAAAAYRKVVLEHAAAPHVEDAKERLVAMNLEVPTPTPEAVAESEALEGSRAQYTMQKRLELLVLRKPDTVTAAQSGEPPLDDPNATTAPEIVKGLEHDFTLAVNPKAKLEPPAAPKKDEPVSDADAAPAPPPPPASTAAPTLEDVPTAGNGSGTGSVSEMSPATETTGGSGTGMGVEILNNGNTGSKPPSDLPAATGKADPNFGLTTAAPKNNTALPAAEQPAEAPDQVNEASGKPQPAAPATEPSTNKKNKAKTTETYDKGDESSSKRKPKKGLDKLNPF
jgi:outer membrane protein assembly factor BamD